MDLDVPYIDLNLSNSRMDDISLALDKFEKHTIQKRPWPEFSYRPDVSFSIAHNDQHIFLKFFVSEKAIRVTHHEDNSPVHEDSCVEFFISFGTNEGYYNMEFNCAGTCLVGFGNNGSERKLVDVKVLKQIRRLSSIKKGSHSINWELTVIIPAETFVYHTIASFKEKKYRVNFYKCGDKLPQPHFLSWQDMKTSSPDFHISEFFGNAYFR